MTPAYWNEAKTHLSKHDKTLGKIIKTYKGEMLTSRGDAFYTLARSIAGQQISVKAADTIWKRLEDALNNPHPTLSLEGRGITPDNMLATSPEILRAAGLSSQKVAYMHALAEHFTENEKRIKGLHKFDDEEIIAELTSVKGLGRWTVEMFLIFHMGRPDVLPLADIGLQKAIFKHYNKGEKLPKAELVTLAEPWKPYRSVATWYLWRSLDPVPVEY
jgi:DNA-3-methyladenine glycosylase II